MSAWHACVPSHHYLRCAMGDHDHATCNIEHPSLYTRYTSRRISQGQPIRAGFWMPLPRKGQLQKHANFLHNQFWNMPSARKGNNSRAGISINTQTVVLTFPDMVVSGTVGSTTTPGVGYVYQVCRTWYSMIQACCTYIRYIASLCQT